MNEELQKALLAILNKTVSAAEAGMSFLQKELPEVIQQLLMWKAIESALIFVVMLSITVTCVVLAAKLFKYAKEYKPKNIYDDADGYHIGVFLLSVGAVISLVFTLCSFTWLQILIAPKLYLIEFAASLAK